MRSKESRKGSIHVSASIDGRSGETGEAPASAVSAVGFEPTSANTVELESTPLDRSGTLTSYTQRFYTVHTNSTHAIHHTASAHAVSLTLACTQIDR